MILLLTFSGDLNIDLVITWLKHFKQEYIRINADEVIENEIQVSITEKSIKYKNKNICIDDIRAVWYRKFGYFSESNYFDSTKGIISTDDLQQLAHEFSAILSVLVSLLKKKKWLTAPWVANLNKLDILLLARECGLDIPESYIISKKNQLLELQKNTGKIFITKSIYEHYFIHTQNHIFSMFTKEIINIDNIPSLFFPSLIQEKILKEYELRIFYINGEFYTMAIFSQGNKNTELDFRKYYLENPNRNVPYNLPCAIKEKLLNMLNKMKLNCCSIDIIKSSSDDKYYFLEINPTGAFGMTTIPCNYEV